MSEFSQNLAEDLQALAQYVKDSLQSPQFPEQLPRLQPQHSFPPQSTQQGLQPHRMRPSRPRMPQSANHRQNPNELIARMDQISNQLAQMARMQDQIANMMSQLNHTVEDVHRTTTAKLHEISTVVDGFGAWGKTLLGNLAKSVKDGGGSSTSQPNGSAQRSSTQFQPQTQEHYGNGTHVPLSAKPSGSYAPQVGGETFQADFPYDTGIDPFFTNEG